LFSILYQFVFSFNPILDQSIPTFSSFDQSTCINLQLAMIVFDSNSGEYYFFNLVLG
jgi:hypothetical protein